MEPKIRKRLMVAAVPIVLGVAGALAASPSGRIAFIEGPLPIFLLTAGLIVGAIAAGVLTLLDNRNPAPSPTLATAGAASGVEERLEMLERLESVVTARLDSIGAQLDDIDHPSVEGARTEMRRLERFLVDVHGVAALHDLELNLELTDPLDIVNQALSSASRAGGDRILKADLPTAEVEPLRADRRLLTLALVNLVINAIKFSRPSSPIVVRVIDGEDRVIFEVEDEGPGVPEGENVWTELVRGSNAGDTPGTGLGLPLVRLICERHGGTAALVSDTSGTVARMTIPRP